MYAWWVCLKKFSDPSKAYKMAGLIGNFDEGPKLVVRQNQM